MNNCANCGLQASDADVIKSPAWVWVKHGENGRWFCCGDCAALKLYSEYIDRTFLSLKSERSKRWIPTPDETERRAQ